MDEKPIQFRLGVLAGLMLASAAAGWACGGWATWRLAGREGLAGMAAAFGAAAVAFAGGLAITLWRAGRGPGPMATGFVLASPARVVLTLGLAFLAWSWGGWSPRIVFLWAAIWYLLFLAAEVIWLGLVLRTRR